MNFRFKLKRTEFNDAKNTIRSEQHVITTHKHRNPNPLQQIYYYFDLLVVHTMFNCMAHSSQYKKRMVRFNLLNAQNRENH